MRVYTVCYRGQVELLPNGIEFFSLFCCCLVPVSTDTAPVMPKSKQSACTVMFCAYVPAVCAHCCVWDRAKQVQAASGGYDQEHGEGSPGPALTADCD